MFSTAPPVFVSVTGCGALVVVTVWLGKVREADERVAAGPGPPIPLNGIVCGLLAALSVMVTDPYRLPLAVGVKVTLIVQFAPAATVVPHELACAKSPVAATLVMINDPLPLFVKVTVCAGVLVDPNG
jgi:hypothetical protein